MLPADMREPEWKNHIAGSQDAIIILEGVSMYFTPEELVGLLSSISEHFFSVRLLMDCYTKRGAKFSRYRNPINEVGVNVVYGYDRPQQLVNKTGFLFVKEHSLTPKKYIDELHHSTGCMNLKRRSGNADARICIILCCFLVSN